MGNSSQKPADYLIVRSYRPEDWRRQADKKGLQIWSHKQTHERVEVYPLQEIPSIEDMRRYEVRSSQQHLVRTFHIAVNNSQTFCVASQFAQLLIEHIPIRLSMVSNLDLQQTLTVLYAAFKGFEIISMLFGTVKPSEQLIGFNSEGKPKVWLNKQFHLNFCEAEIKYSTINQSHEIRNIYKMVTSRMQGQKISENLTRQILNQDRTYQQASEIVEEYALRQELSLKRYVRVDVLERQFHRQKLSRHSSTDNLLPQEKLVFSRTHQFKTPVIHRYQSCESLHAKLQKQQSNVLTEKRSIILPVNQSYCSLSPASHNCRSIPKITFNNSALKSTQDTLHQNTIEAFKQMPRFDFANSAHPSKYKLHKISANQIPTKMPHIIFAKTNRPFPHKKSARFGSEAATEINQNASVNNKKGSIMQRQQSLSKDHIQLTELRDRQERENMETASPGKVTIASQQSIIDRVSKLQQNHCQSGEQYKKTVELQFEGIREDIQVSGVFQEPHQQGKQPQVREPIAQEQVGDKYKKVAFSLPPTQKRDIPINFQSFAPSMENISFAPKFLEQDGENELVQTSKSVEIEEQPEESSLQANSCEMKQPEVVKLVESGEEYLSSDPPGQAVPAQPDYRHMAYNRYSRVSSRHSNQEHEEQPTILCQASHEYHPFYKQCTPVQSKFHIVLKKDSNIEVSDNEHSNRVSAFAQVELQDTIKNEFNNMFQQEGIRLNRVSSQYEMLNEKHSQPAHSQRIMKKDASGHVRSHINLGQANKDQEDFLDVKFLEKSLDIRYRDAKNKSQIKQEEDELNISKLDEKLEKFSNSRISINKKPDHSEKIQSVALPQTDSSKLVSELAIDSERFESRKVTSIQYEPSYIDEHREAAKDSCRVVPEDRDKIADFYELVEKQKDCDFFGRKERIGYMAVQEEGFNSKTKAYQSLQRARDQVKYKTYQAGVSWRKYNNAQQMNSARKDSTKLLEERYEKYVKQSERQSKRQSTDYESAVNHAYTKKTRQSQRYSQKIQPAKGLKQVQGGGKRISYDYLRSILWN